MNETSTDDAVLVSFARRCLTGQACCNMTVSGDLLGSMKSNSSVRHLLSDRLNGDINANLITDRRCELSCVEFRAFDRGVCVCTDGIFLEHRVLFVGKRCDGKRDRLGDALDRQVAVDFGWLAVLEDDTR